MTPRRRPPARGQEDLESAVRPERTVPVPAEESAAPRETSEYVVLARFEQWHIGDRIWLFADDPRTAGLVATGLIRPA